jgi:hypothetical protein
VALDVGLYGKFEPAVLELLDCLFDGSQNARIDGDVGRLERRKRLGANVAGQDRFGSRSGYGLSCLDARALRGIEVLDVIVCGERARFGIDQHEVLGPTETGIDGAIQAGSLRRYGEFHALRLLLVEAATMPTASAPHPPLLPAAARHDESLLIKASGQKSGQYLFHVAADSGDHADPAFGQQALQGLRNAGADESLNAKLGESLGAPLRSGFAYHLLLPGDLSAVAQLDHEQLPGDIEHRR